jgi:hypothetical protein
MIPTKMTLKFSALSLEVDSEDKALSSLIQGRMSANCVARGAVGPSSWSFQLVAAGFGFLAQLQRSQFLHKMAPPPGQIRYYTRKGAREQQPAC